MEIKNVTILGANGTMGYNVAGIFASFGDANVYLVSRKKEDSEKAKEKAIKSVRADSIANKLIPTTYDELENCISKSDLIFESVFESIELKKEIYHRINPYLSEKTIIVTGSSGLSINELSSAIRTENQDKFLGMHMFNPPYYMSLCELIPSKKTKASLIKELSLYLKKKLLRDVIVVKDQPAFLANRIGFQFMNHLLLKAEEFSDYGGIDYIDSIFCGITGRAMAPLKTIDFVGLDIHEVIVNNIQNKTDDIYKESFKTPDFLNYLIQNKFLGNKTKKGLYENSKVYDISTGTYREIKNYEIRFINESKEKISEGDYKSFIDELIKCKTKEALLIKESLLSYVLYSLTLSKDLSDDIHAADHAMAHGFGWIPPLSIIDALGGKDKFIEIIENSNIDFDTKNLLTEDLKRSIKPSIYDYRKFLRAR